MIKVERKTGTIGRQVKFEGHSSNWITDNECLIVEQKLYCSIRFLVV